MLHELSPLWAARTPEALAISDARAALSYCDLERLIARIAAALAAQGVEPHARVGIWIDKSAGAIAAAQAVLRLGAVYVPIDPLSPVVRVAAMIQDCEIRCLVTDARREGLLTEQLGRNVCRAVCLERVSEEECAPSFSGRTGHPDELAYILYTSGSTGKPKGVCISHSNAQAFVRWAAQELGASPRDRFANHAPLHFDLSVLDIYAALTVGASVHLIPDALAFAPAALVDWARQEKITIWYSVPSVLMLMLGDEHFRQSSLPDLRCILFAGEVFPINALRRLREAFPSVRLLNLYGPTETNVCTFYEVHALDPQCAVPVPIGKACCGDRVWAVTEAGGIAAPGQEGELHVSGPTVMRGYWGREPQAEAPYATGDIVRLEPDGNYSFIGRVDHMVKLRGHRIDLGEIEAVLQLHPAIREAAVFVRGSSLEARLAACVVSTAELTLLALKRHCAERLPRYMIIDELNLCQSLPRNRNGKLDRALLHNSAAAADPR